VRDFGVRALLATLITVGLVAGSIYCLVCRDVQTLKEFINDYGPFEMATIAFYFAASTVQKSPTSTVNP